MRDRESDREQEMWPGRIERPVSHAVLGTLLESGARPPRRRGLVALSAVVHAAVILLAVRVTAGGMERLAVPSSPEVVGPTYLQPAAPLEHRGPTSGGSAPTDPPRHDVPLPPIPIDVTVPVTDVPVGLPSVDESLGDPLREASRHRSINGSHATARRGSGPAGGVYDNRIAEKPAVPLEGNAPPAYPPALRMTGIEGVVEVEFVIDSSGRLRPGSMVVVRSDHAAFLAAVRDALPLHRYLPAEVAGEAVAVRVRQRFAFTIGPER